MGPDASGTWRGRAPAPATPTGVDLHASDDELRRFLDEDLGTPWSDVTTDHLFQDEEGQASIVTRQACTVSGMEEARRIFELVGASCTMRSGDGERADAGARLAVVYGPVRAILRGERTALNIIGRMSGVATLCAATQARVSAVSSTCHVAATRKTTPGFRLFEKRAVWHGGGDPHRWGLWDQVLIKDNHRAAGGDLEALVRRLREATHETLVEVEVESAPEAVVAAQAGADMILVDNQSPDMVAKIAAAVRAERTDILIEASGGITPETAAAYAPHCDRISLGALTQAAPAIDVGLDWH